MIGHLGDRVSALLDGQLSPAEEERAWAHVHACHQCRDLVEREGWVKTRLAGLSFEASVAPLSLKGSLLSSLSSGRPPGDVYLGSEPADRAQRQHPVAPGLGQPPHVLDVVDPVRQHVVVAAVPLDHRRLVGLDRHSPDRASSDDREPAHPPARPA